MKGSASKGCRCRWMVTLGIVVWICTGPLMADQPLQPLPSPRLAPPFHLRDLQGHFHHLADFQGRVVIVNFWASWCAPCRKELPSMNRAWARLAAESVVLLAVNVAEEPPAVEGFLQDLPIDFQVLLDSSGNTSQRWQVKGLPTTFVLNGRGEIVYRVVGERRWDDEGLLRQIRELRVPATGQEPLGINGRPGF